MGSVAAKMVGLLSMPVLARLYTPENFGRLSFFIATTAVIGSLVTFRYVAALPIPKSQIRAQALLLTVTSLALASSVIATILLFGIARVCTRAKWCGLDVFWTEYWWLVSLGSLGVGLYEILTMWANRERRYTALAKSQFWQAISGTSVKLVGGFVAPGPVSLILGQVVQQSGGILGLVGSALVNLKRAWRRFRGKHIAAILVRFSDFAVYKLPAHFIYALAAQAPILLGMRIWGAAVTGQLGLAFQVVALPTVLISQNVSKVYYGELASIGRANPETASQLTKDMLHRMLLFGAVASAGLFAIAPTAFSIVFGAKWALAGDIARALALYIPAQFIASPIMAAFNIYGNQRQVLVIHASRGVLVIATLFACSHFGLQVTHTMYVYSGVLAAHYIYTARKALQIIKGC